ncbi:MAG: nitroreductase [Gammaproteobacteria bacterium]|nr:nitroreductase [Gammaproteobacteria bacterium]
MRELEKNQDKSGKGARPADRQAVEQCLVGRRTINRFIQRPVAQELLLEAIECARWAPNHLLSEPWYFYILGEQAVAATIESIYTLTKEKKGEEMGQRKVRRAQKIPAWVVVTCQRSSDVIRQREDYAATSCAIHNFSLSLWTRGIGMKWCTGALVEDQRYYARLGIDYDQELMVGILRIGYPQIIPRQRRKNVDEISMLLD